MSDRHIPVTVSFSVIPSRAMNLKWLMSDLFNQTVRPGRIIVSYCENYKRVKGSIEPELIDRLKKNFKNTVFKLVEDQGPIVKWLSALEDIRNENERVVIIDDDRRLPPRFIEGLIKHDDLNTSVLGYRGRVLTESETYKSSILYGTEQAPITDSPLRVDIMTAAGGVAFKRSIFPEGFLDYWRAISLRRPDLIYTDDIWVNGFLEQHRIERKVVPKLTKKTGQVFKWLKWRMSNRKKLSTADALWTINSISSANDHSIRICLRPAKSDLACDKQARTTP